MPIKAAKKKVRKPASNFAARTGRALLETLAVLTVAMLAAAISMLAFKYIHVDGNAAPWFAVSFVTVAIVTLYLLHRGSYSTAVEDLNARLLAKPRLKTEYAKRALYLDLDPERFADACERIPDDGEDVMLVCREAKDKKKLYDTDKISDQLQNLSGRKLRHRVKWAVFTDSANNFVAFQDLETFLMQFLGTWSTLYRSALNEIDPAKFRDELESILRMQAEAAETPGQPYLRVPNANLEFRKLDQSDTRREMIAKLFEYGIGETVVVAGGKPVGIISLADLVDGAFGPMLEKTEFTVH